MKVYMNNLESRSVAVLAWSSATDSASRRQVTRMTTSQDIAFGCKNSAGNPAKYFAGNGYSQICQKWPAAGPAGVGLKSGTWLVLNIR